MWLRNNVLGLVAIFIALSGTAIATNAASESDQATKAAKGKRGPRGPAGPAGPQGTQGPAGSPDTGAQILTKLLPVDGTASGLDADTLDGLNSSVFLTTGASAGGDLDGTYPSPMLRAPEGWHEVGAGGEPAFANGWANVPGGSTAAFYKDRQGIVHLKGLIEDGSETMPAFTLPVGYLPGTTKNFPAISYNPGPVSLANVQIGPTGPVVIVSEGTTADGITLEGITFRPCGAPGAEACG